MRRTRLQRHRRAPWQLRRRSPGGALPGQEVQTLSLRPWPRGKPGYEAFLDEAPGLLHPAQQEGSLGMPSVSFSGLQRGRQLRLRESYDATLLSPRHGRVLLHLPVLVELLGPSCLKSDYFFFASHNVACRLDLSNEPRSACQQSRLLVRPGCAVEPIVKPGVLRYRGGAGTDEEQVDSLCLCRFFPVPKPLVVVAAAISCTRWTATSLV